MMYFPIAIIVISILAKIFVLSEMGGSIAPNHAYPYQAALKKKNRFLCGASIMNERWLLTAAHCIILIRVPRHGTVLVGTNKVNERNATEYPIEYLLPHEDYNKDFLHANDIGLIRVARNIQFNQFVQPAKFPVSNDAYHDGTTVVLSGWGAIIKGSRVPARLLRHITLRIMNHLQCAKEWKHGRNRTILESQICTNGKLQKSIATPGDSGSPLVVQGVQIGVLSFAWKNLSDVFSKMTFYLPWIRRNMIKIHINRKQI